MTYLTAHLPFPSTPLALTIPSSSSTTLAQSLPPPSSHLIISDTLASPGDFALYHLVAAAIARKLKVVWVDFRGEGRASWEAVMKKLATPLPSPTSQQSIHISPSSLPLPSGSSTTSNSSPALFGDDGEATLGPTYEALSSHLPKDSSNASAGPLILLDGLTELLWMGFTPIQVSQFVRAVFAQSRRAGAILISTLHADHLPSTSINSATPILSESVDTNLLERLIRIGGGGWWRISGLSSGRSGDVMGEISSHPLFPPNPPAASTNTIPSFPSIPHSKPLQYRLESNTVKLFPKGTGRGFL